MSDHRRDQYTFTDPSKLYSEFDPKRQHQPEPGLEAELEPRPDLGEETYRGTGRLQGRKALVTGADSGIGAATVIAFAREGADVVMAYLPEEEKDAQRVASIAQDAGVQVFTIPGDLRDPAYCRDLVARAVQSLGGLDLVVNNGGKQVYVEDLTDLSDEQFDDTFKTNVYAMFWITKAATAPPSAGLDDHQHHLDPGIRAFADPRRLRLDEGDHQRVHEGRCAAARPEGNPRQRGRTRPGLDRAASHGRTAAGEARGVRREHPARPHGPARRARPRVRLPRVSGIELRCR